MLKPEKRKKILVIDDDRINRAIIAEILEENFDVIEKADIDTAYALEENTKQTQNPQRLCEYTGHSYNCTRYG